MSCSLRALLSQVARATWTMGMCALAAGCASIGPGTIGRDRIDYDHAVAESWQRQLLLNMVKIRYGDTPLFLDVASITNSYGIETQVSAGAGWNDILGMGINNSQNVGGGARYTDKPTITYSPMTGSRFTRSLMTPLTPAVVVSLIQAGWPADAVMSIMVSSVNGVQNRFASGGRARGADPEFYHLIDALRHIQATGAIGMRIDRTKDAETGVTVMEWTKHRGAADPTAQDRQAVRQILGLREGLDEVRVIFGSTRRGDDEIAMVTRSMLEVLMDLSGSAIEAPPAHVEDGRVSPSRAFDTDPDGRFTPLLTIHSGADKPTDPFVVVQYRGQWFWIDDRDYRSKGMFSFLLILSSLTETDSPKGAPVITIPAG